MEYNSSTSITENQTKAKAHTQHVQPRISHFHKI